MKIRVKQKTTTLSTIEEDDDWLLPAEVVKPAVKEKKKPVITVKKKAPSFEDIQRLGVPITASNFDPRILRFITLVMEHPPGAGLGEYLLWKAVEEKLTKPFPLFRPFANDDLEMLKEMRDTLKVWPSFNVQTSDWNLCPVEVWRDHLRKYGFSSAFQYHQEWIVKQAQLSVK